MFQLPIACPDTFSRQAASAIEISPCSTDNTMGTFPSTGIVRGRLLIQTFRQGRCLSNEQPPPHNLPRDRRNKVGIFHASFLLASVLALDCGIAPTVGRRLSRQIGSAQRVVSS